LSTEAVALQRAMRQGTGRTPLVGAARRLSAAPWPCSAARPARPLLPRALGAARPLSVDGPPHGHGLPRYMDRQRWVGRRVQPEDAAFTVLPWGFVPQQLVKEKIVPEALRRKRESGERGFLAADNQLKIFGSSVADVQEGAELAYRFVANTFSEGDPVFEEEHSAQVDRHLGACFDSQLRLLSRSESLVEVHAVHEVVVTCAFPLMLCDPTNPENLARSDWLWRAFGINPITAQFHFAKLMLSLLYQQVRSQQDEGLRVAVEVIVRTTETAHFGPLAGQRVEDAEHVLWFYGGRDADILSAGSVDFELANMNEALSMIQDTATPDAWAVPST